MRVLDLFAGLGGWSNVARERGHDVRTLDNDPRFGCDYTMDILSVTPATFGDWRPDIILASPPCEAFSVMTIGRNWAPGRMPKTDKARISVELVSATRRLVDEMRPAYFIIENPRAMLRKLVPLADLERRTVTYCQYGEPFMKPTDLWGGFPPSLHLKPMCRPRSPCHMSAPRGSTTGIQGNNRARWTHPALLAQSNNGFREDERARAWRESVGETDQVVLAAIRAKVPDALALAVIEAAERDYASGALPIPATLWGAA